MPAWVAAAPIVAWLQRIWDGLTQADKKQHEAADADERAIEEDLAAEKRTRPPA